MESKQLSKVMRGTPVEQALRFDANQPRLATAKLAKGTEGSLRAYQRGQFLLGRLDNGQAVGFKDDKHVFICSSTRGGKGVSLIVPNLIDWPGSTVVIDPKGENAAITAKRRRIGSAYCHGLGQSVHILDPFDTVAANDAQFESMRAAFNPLDLISADKPESIDEAARIADAITVREANSEPFWADAQAEYIQMMILHVATAPEIPPEKRNLITVRNLLIAGDIAAAEKVAAFVKKGKPPTPFNMLFAAMKRNRAFDGLVSQAGHKFDNLERSSARLFNSIVQVADTNTGFLKSPAMQRCVEKSTFSLSELKTSKAGSNLYICLPQRYMETHFRWLRMMTTLVVTEMERVKGQPASGHPVLMVLDEFPALKRMRVLENAAAQIAGFGVKMVFIAQTLAQLKDTYKDNWETLLANAGTKLFFCTDDDFTQSHVSKLMGEYEFKRYTVNYSRSAGSSQSASYNSSKSWSESASSTMSSTGSSSTYGDSKSETHGSSISRGRNESETIGFTESLHKRALFTPDELGRVFGPRSRKILTLVSGESPVILDRFYYFADQRFWETFDPHPDHAPPLTLLQSAERRKRIAREEAAERERQRIRRKQLDREREFDEARDYILRMRYQREYEERRRREKLREEIFSYIRWAIAGGMLGIIGPRLLLYFGWL